MNTLVAEAIRPSSLNGRKILTLEELAEAVARLKAADKTVVHCHGVYDLLHVGHIKHLKAARTHGDVLVVTITQDKHVNKGPHRPAFCQDLRAEALAALSCVDYVAINEWPSAVETIHLIKPNIFCKGYVKGKGKRDFTDAISLEEKAVVEEHGKMLLTEEPTFSASHLINNGLDLFPPETRKFLDQFREKYSAEEVVSQLERLREMKILVVGEAIIDEYIFCDVMGRANKDPILAARYLYSEKYAGGSLAIANHLGSFCNNVGLLSMLGEQDSHIDFISGKLNPNIHPYFLRKPDSPTIVKRRFLQEYMAVKLFEVYQMRNEQCAEAEENAFISRLEDLQSRYDVIIVADYGHGLISDRAIQLLSQKSKFLAVNAQTNAGNRGFNMITRYPRADFISIDEPEARLETRNLKVDEKELIKIILGKTACPTMLLTLGKRGTMCFNERTGYNQMPALGRKAVDRMGAGDAVLALASPCVALGLPLDLVSFIGNIAGAEACAIMGNKAPIDYAGFCRHVTSLLQ